jgi:hypothetical protein
MFHPHKEPVVALVLVLVVHGKVLEVAVVVLAQMGLMQQVAHKEVMVA